MTKRIVIKDYGNGVFAESYYAERSFYSCPVLELVTYKPRKIFKGKKRIILDEVSLIIDRFSTQQELRELLVAYGDNLYLRRQERIRRWEALNGVYTD